MENASKALFMAASVLIAMMLIGVFIYVFREGGKVGENFEAKQAQEQLELYNSKFVYFQRENNTISDIISVTNLASSVNEMNEFNQKYSVTIDIQMENEWFCVTSKYPIEKNYIYVGASSTINSVTKSKIYTYDLMNHLKEKLCEYKGDTLEKTTTKIFTGPETVWEDDESLSKVKKKDTGRKETIYKYLFNCEVIEYNADSGRINYMQFKLVKNPLYT